MKKCPRCKFLGIPNEANFCPHCGQQLTEGKWVIVNLAQKSSTSVQIEEVPKKFTLQNDTRDTLQLYKDSSTRYQLPPYDSCTIEVTRASSLRVVSNRFYSKDIKLYHNDVFNRIIIYNIGDSLQYRTN